MFVMKGRGATSIWQKESQGTVEWRRVIIPLNAWHQNSMRQRCCRVVLGPTWRKPSTYHNREFAPPGFNSRTTFYFHGGLFCEGGTHWNLQVFETNYRHTSFELDPIPKEATEHRSCAFHGELFIECM
jgi:hypothetical protein